jgi:4-amino-4-deoxy-L-arabinose transferase-like glycosyltransferase
MKRLPRSFHTLAALILCLFAFAMSAILSRTVFERLPHLEDELAYLWQARTYARGQLVIATPEPEDAFWQPFVVDHEGRRFGKYTPGYPALLAVGVLLGQTWIVNALLAMTTVALVYRIGRDVFDRDVGLIAAALVAFSPMALLLNATLMGHTAALCCAALFAWALWNVEHRRRKLAWGVIGGLALGLLVANRALTGVAFALPFALWSGVRLLRPLRAWQPVQVGALPPLLALSAATLLLASSIPLYNYAATGSPTQNLYTLVWSYDRLGFGEGAGRNTHTLEKGIRHARFDLSLTAADLFGWQIGTIDEAAREHLRTESDYYPHIGVSWALLPFGLLAIYRRRTAWMALWLAALAAWVVVPHLFDGGDLTRDPTFAYIWVVVALAWALLPVLLARSDQTRWTGLLLASALCLVGLQVAYWIGSQRYSTRYYYEALMPLALVSAVPLAWLARRGLRAPLYALLALALAYSLFAYSLPRIGVLYGYNLIGRAQIEQVMARRVDERPVLVLVSGERVRWRAFGALMAQTEPFLDSEIVAAWNYRGDSSDAVREQILARFPDRQVIEMQARENQAWFSDEDPPTSG